MSEIDSAHRVTNEAMMVPFSPPCLRRRHTAHRPPRARGPALLLGLLALAGCPHSPAEGESIPEVCKKENDGKTVSVSGYLVAPKMMTFCSPTCTMRLSTSKGEGEDTLSTAFKVGDGNGTMRKLPDSFTAKDVQVTDDGGKTFGVGSAVRLTGTVSVNDSL